MATEEQDEIDENQAAENAARTSGRKRKVSDRYAEFDQQIKGSSKVTASSSSAAMKNFDSHASSEGQWGPYYVVPVASVLQTSSLIQVVKAVGIGQ